MAEEYRDLPIEESLKKYATHDLFSLAIHLARYRVAAQFVQRGTQAIDFGCGPGFGTALLAEAGAAVTGVDHYQEVIQHARETYADLHFETGDVLHWDQPPQSLDLITAFELIEHLDRPEDFLRQCATWLRPGGRLVLSTPNKLVHLLLRIQWPYHVREYGYSELRELLAACFPDAGIEILGQNPHMMRHYHRQLGRFRPYDTTLRKIIRRLVPPLIIRSARKLKRDRPTVMQPDDPILRDATEISAANVDVCDTFIVVVTTDAASPR
jgi:2-polyprenyl-3-methyl-5-hydroxy-6-metoxy-1,4-benzoquinol methylase